MRARIEALPAQLAQAHRALDSRLLGFEQRFEGWAELVNVQLDEVLRGLATLAEETAAARHAAEEAGRNVETGVAAIRDDVASLEASVEARLAGISDTLGALARMLALSWCVSSSRACTRGLTWRCASIRASTLVPGSLKRSRPSSYVRRWHGAAPSSPAISTIPSWSP